MKLYTEEQVKEILDRAFNIELGTYEQMSEYLLSNLTPIELPSDEEIDKVSLDFADQEYFSYGAKWMKEQILNQNKLIINSNGKVGLSNPNETTNNKLTINQNK